MSVRSLVRPSLGVASVGLTCCHLLISPGVTELASLSCAYLAVRIAAILHIGRCPLNPLSSVLVIWSLGPSPTVVIGIPSFVSKFCFSISSGDAYFTVCLLSYDCRLASLAVPFLISHSCLISSAPVLDPLLSVRLDRVRVVTSAPLEFQPF